VFTKDKVQQESIILTCSKGTALPSVSLSFSEGVHDLGSRATKNVPLSVVLHPSPSGPVLRLPKEVNDGLAVALIDSLSFNLQTLGLSVSTGPVVAFLAKAYIQSKGPFPLLWMHNVKPMRIEWPLSSLIKDQHMSSLTPHKLLVPSSKNMVLIRRFSAKEQARRIVAAPIRKEELNQSHLGLENHLNFIREKVGEMSWEVALGLASLLNSKLYDRYLRVSSGNTQVSATELSLLPLPAREVIESLGKRVLDEDFLCKEDLADIDALVEGTLSKAVKQKEEEEEKEKGGGREKRKPEEGLVSMIIKKEKLLYPFIFH